MKLILWVFLLSFMAISPKQKSARKHPLPEHINELSGLTFVNDSVLVGHNDGGDRPVLYFLSTNATLLHECYIKNATNVDWEDLTKDEKGNLYIGDIGNNQNDRKNLRIYRVRLIDAMIKDTVDAESFGFTYPDQKSFPPAENELYYDAEALSWHNDSLYIFTKCRTKPFDGNSHVYSLSTDMLNQTATYLNDLNMGTHGWWQDAITASDIRGKMCYVMTYNRINVYKIKKGTLRYSHGIPLRPITQKEAIAVDSQGRIMVGDERTKLLGGGYLYNVDDKKRK